MKTQQHFYDVQGEVKLPSETIPFEETGISAYSEKQAKFVVITRLKKQQRFEQFVLTPAIVQVRQYIVH
jgi:hypothetical protein